MSIDLKTYKPTENEAEKASNSYLMSLLVLLVGLPLPIVNLIATVVFYYANRKSTFFVRWHCTQALISQIFVFIPNSIAFYWTISLLFGDSILSNQYIAYLITLFIFNVIEFVATLQSAIKTRKGKQIEWWFIGPLTHILCKS